MGELQSKSNGYYILNAKIGAVTVEKALMQADISLDEIKQLPKTDDFYLHIPDQPIEPIKEK